MTGHPRLKATLGALCLLLLLGCSKTVRLEPLDNPSVPASSGRKYVSIRLVPFEDAREMQFVVVRKGLDIGNPSKAFYRAAEPVTEWVENGLRRAFEKNGFSVTRAGKGEMPGASELMITGDLIVAVKEPIKATDGTAMSLSEVKVRLMVLFAGKRFTRVFRGKDEAKGYNMSKLRIALDDLVTQVSLAIEKIIAGA